MLLRLAYLSVANVFALLRLLPRSDHDKDAEILVLRHQVDLGHRHWATEAPVPEHEAHGHPTAGAARTLRHAVPPAVVQVRCPCRGTGGRPRRARRRRPN